MRSALLFLGVISLPAWAQDPRYVNRIAPFVASPTKVVELMLDMAKIKPGETLYDLGSGDGRIVIAAVKNFKAKAVGVEIMPKQVKEATDEIEKLGLSASAKVIQGDVLQVDLTGADVVTMYLDTQTNAKLKPRLEKFLKPGARVVSHDYPIPGWKAAEVEHTDGRQEHTVYLYLVKDKK